MSEVSQEFFLLVASLSTGAMTALGKLANPMTGKTEKNLDAAKQQIDMIAMLESKTKGNLTDDESKYLTETLTQLRVNYVQESSKEEKGEPESPKNSAKEDKKEEG